MNDEFTIVEAPAIEQLKKLGFEHIQGDALSPDIANPERGSWRDVVLVNRLRQSLKKINPWLSEDNLNKAVHDLTFINQASLIESNRWLYENLSVIMNSIIPSPFYKNSTTTKLVGDACLELTRTELFKILPAHEKYYVPRSEYLFKYMQPYFDDILFSGKGYEDDFDVFEVIFALAYANIKYSDSHIWGPIGRFGWKYPDNNVIRRIIDNAKAEGNNWKLLKSGFFNGSMDRFLLVSEKYEDFIKRLPWI